MSTHPAKPKIISEFEPSEFVFTETPAFKPYCDEIEKIIMFADESTDPNYRGLTLREINLRMGAKANLDLTAASVHSLGLFQYQVPTRYSFIDRRVRVIPPSEWPEQPVIAKPRVYDSRIFVPRISGFGTL